jgi:diguanylate cyclase (GGDEF)-like protein/PAS domain S-box-containing protein
VESPVPDFPNSISNEPPPLLKDILEGLLEGLYVADRERKIIYWNQAAERLTGYKAEEVLGKQCSDNFLMQVDCSGCLLCGGECPVSLTLKDGRPRREEVYFHHRSGHKIPVEIMVGPIRGRDSEVIGAVELFHDNSRQRAVRERAKALAKFAFLDPTSQVGNRRYLEQQLAQHLDEYSKRGIPFGIIMADLDEFKAINDTYGHAIGDAALVSVGKTLSNCFRASDAVGRWGGDEFMAILLGITKESLTRASEKFRSLVAQSTLRMDGRLIRVTVSVGGAIVDPGDSRESLMKRVDHHLYASKGAGRNRVSL